MATRRGGKGRKKSIQVFLPHSQEEIDAGLKNVNSLVPQTVEELHAELDEGIEKTDPLTVLDDEERRRDDWQYTYINRGYDHLHADEEVDDLDRMTLRGFSDEEMVAVDTLQEKLQGQYHRQDFLTFCQSVDFVGWMPLKWWSVLTVWLQDSEISVGWRVFLIEKMKMIDVDVIPTDVSLSDVLYDELRGLLSRGCTQTDYVRVVTELFQEYDVYDDQDQEGVLDFDQRWLLRMMVRQLPWTDETIAALNDMEEGILKPTVAKLLHGDFDFQMMGMEGVKQNPLLQLNIHLTLEILFVLSGDYEIYNQTSMEWVQFLMTHMMIASPEMNEENIRILLEKMPSHSDVPGNDFSLFVDTIGEMTEVFAEKKRQWRDRIDILSIGSRNEEKNKLIAVIDGKISCIVQFFQGLQQHAKGGSDFPVCVVRALGDVDTGWRVGEEKLGVEFAYFDNMRKKMFLQWCEKYGISYVLESIDLGEDSLKFLTKHGLNIKEIANGIVLSFDNSSEDFLKQALFEISYLGFGKNTRLPLLGIDRSRSIDFFAHRILGEIKNLYATQAKESKITFLGNYKTSDIVYELFFDMMERGDTSFLESALWKDKWSDRIYFGYENEDKKYVDKVHMVWNMAVKKNYQDVADAMTAPQGGKKSGYNWTTSTERLHDMTDKGIEFVGSRFVVLNSRFLVRKDEHQKIENFAMQHQGGNVEQALQHGGVDGFKYIDLYDIDGQTILHHQIGSELSEDGLKDLLSFLGDDFDFEKKCVVEKRGKYTDIKRTAYQTMLVGGDMTGTRVLGKKMYDADHAIDLYETVIQRARRTGNFETQGAGGDSESQGASVIHLLARYGDVAQIDDALTRLKDSWNFFDESYSSGRTKHGRFNRQKYVALLLYVDPSTGLSGLWTLAHYGHMDIVKQLMKRYTISIRSMVDEIMLEVLFEPGILSYEDKFWLMQELMLNECSDRKKNRHHTYVPFGHELLEGLDLPHQDYVYYNLREFTSHSGEKYRSDRVRYLLGRDDGRCYALIGDFNKGGRGWIDQDWELGGTKKQLRFLPSDAYFDAMQRKDYSFARIEEMFFFENNAWNRYVGLLCQMVGDATTSKNR